MEQTLAGTLSRDRTVRIVTGVVLAGIVGLALTAALIAFTGDGASSRPAADAVTSSAATGPIETIDELNQNPRQNGIVAAGSAPVTSPERDDFSQNPRQNPQAVNTVGGQPAAD